MHTAPGIYLYCMKFRIYKIVQFVKVGNGKGNKKKGRGKGSKEQKGGQL